jgi:flagellar M-ring protein FliF
VSSSSVRKVSEFVDKHPEESIAILRNWLHEA